MNVLNFGRILAPSITVLLARCASYGAVAGVDNLWRELAVDEFKKGIITQTPVLDQLGPPSQLISLQEQTVFYYLTEKMSGRGKYLSSGTRSAPKASKIAKSSSSTLKVSSRNLRISLGSQPCRKLKLDFRVLLSPLPPFPVAHTSSTISARPSPWSRSAIFPRAVITQEYSTSSVLHQK